MAIFSDEFKTNAEKIGNLFHRDFSNALSLWWLHVILLFALILGTRIMSTFGVIGINAWWEQYSILNPNMLIEQTTTYWYFVIADVLLFAATAIEFCYVGILLIVWGIGDMKQLEAKAKENAKDRDNAFPALKKTPKCPICKNNMDVIRKGMNADKSCDRFLCKSCGKYFQKKEKE
jgi:hypothetical protein